MIFSAAKDRPDKMFKYFYVTICFAWPISFYFYANNIIKKGSMSAVFLLSCLAVVLAVLDILESNFKPNILKNLKKWKIY